MELEVLWRGALTSFFKLLEKEAYLAIALSFCDILKKNSGAKVTIQKKLSCR
jgi:hypothetical protein